MIRSIIVYALQLCLTAAAWGSVFAADHPDAETLFVKRVLPLLKERCVACHGQDESNIVGGLDLRTFAALLQGGDSETPLIVPGKPDDSPLYLSVLRTDDRWEAMPPKENDALTPAQIDHLKRWIAGGAPWPDADRLAELAKLDDPWSDDDGVKVKTSGGLSSNWTNRRYAAEDLWAYQPLVPVMVPRNGQASQIDAFIAETLARQQLQVAPPADRRSLIRRLTLDLTGLPATLDEIEGFVDDPRSDDAAYAALVDRLFATPAYGEQMGTTQPNRWTIYSGTLRVSFSETFNTP